MGKMRALSKAALLLGVLLMALAAYQLNQYYATGVQAGATIKLLEQQFSALGTDTDTSAALEQSKAVIAETQAAYLNSGVVDLIAGLILVVLGILYAGCGCKCGGSCNCGCDSSAHKH
ncbi:hypothetical protein H0N96_01315 [Candidatus Micrarchaeota archaeon]|nr:hypothetical protein [Candidatus Micrarchaeota archaeon]